MPALNICLLYAVLAALCLMLCTEAMPRLDSEFQDDFYPDLHYRDDADSEHKNPVREDGIGSLLLKNLRFRDLMGQTPHESPLEVLYHARQNLLNEQLQKTRVFDDINSQQYKEISKRADTVSQLAHLINTLKTRNTDAQGVKLQSLRFGKK